MATEMCPVSGAPSSRAAQGHKPHWALAPQGRFLPNVDLRRQLIMARTPTGRSSFPERGMLDPRSRGERLHRTAKDCSIGPSRPQPIRAAWARCRQMALPSCSIRPGEHRTPDSIHWIHVHSPLLSFHRSFNARGRSSFASNALPPNSPHFPGRRCRWRQGTARPACCQTLQFPSSHRLLVHYSGSIRPSTSIHRWHISRGRSGGKGRQIPNRPSSRWSRSPPRRTATGSRRRQSR